jgi:hypothetical protein
MKAVLEEKPSKSVSLVCKEEEEEDDDDDKSTRRPKDRTLAGEKADDRVNRDADNTRNMAKDTRFIVDLDCAGMKYGNG